MKIAAISATCGRHRCIERTISFFLDQDYKDDHFLLIYNNSEVEQSLAPIDFPPNKRVLLVNNHINLRTSERYSNLGDIYIDALTFVPEEYDIITFMDDDDIFLPNHFSSGVAGLERAKVVNDSSYVAYKPEKSYYRDPRGLHLMNNTLEPSIFVERKHIEHYGFSPVTTEQHLQWVVPLVTNNLIYADPVGEPTLIYNWGDTFQTFKTSGNFHDPNNFNNYRTHSRDHGDQIITPADVTEYYNLVKDAKTT